jgi:hypothetical protein
VFPRFFGTIRALRLPAAPLAALRCLRLAIPREHSARFVSPAATECRATGLGLVTRYPTRDVLPWRRQDFPSSWGTPIPVCPCSRTPAGRYAPDQNRTLAWPPLQGRRRRRQIQDFRGSIAWLPGSLSTHHDGGYPTPRKTRFQVLVRLSWTGFPPAGLLQKVSSSHHVRFPPFQASWHNPVRWVALGGCPPRAPTDPYVHALEHTVPRVMDSLRDASLCGQSSAEAANNAPAAG